MQPMTWQISRRGIGVQPDTERLQPPCELLTFSRTLSHEAKHQFPHMLLTLQMMLLLKCRLLIDRLQTWFWRRVLPTRRGAHPPKVHRRRRQRRVRPRALWIQSPLPRGGSTPSCPSPSRHTTPQGILETALPPAQISPRADSLLGALQPSIKGWQCTRYRGVQRVPQAPKDRPIQHMSCQLLGIRWFQYCPHAWDTTMMVSRQAMASQQQSILKGQEEGDQGVVRGC